LLYDPTKIASSVRRSMTGKSLSHRHLSNSERVRLAVDHCLGMVEVEHPTPEQSAALFMCKPSAVRVELRKRKPPRRRRSKDLVTIMKRIRTQYGDDAVCAAIFD
jgi:hypothetical protein